MTEIIRGPLTGFSFLLLAALASPNGSGAEEPGCNNKYCNDPPGGEPEFYTEQVNGPQTHCLEDEVMCLWDGCGET